MATELLGHGNATTLLSVHPGPRRNGRTREVRAGSSLPREVLRMGVGCGGLDRVAGGETVSALALHRMRVWLLRSHVTHDSVSTPTPFWQLCTGDSPQNFSSMIPNPVFHPI